jgi:hypothetical protein
MITAYPLQWPLDWPPTLAVQQRYGKFGTKKTSPGTRLARTVDITVAEATNRVLDELARPVPPPGQRPPP